MNDLDLCLEVISYPSDSLASCFPLEGDELASYSNF